MSDQTMTGRVVGGAYRITGFQRSGRMGDIYLGRKIDTDQLVSVKMLDPALFGEQEAVRRFERETKILTRLNHPCTLVVLDYGRTEDGLPYMVIEHVEGELLSDRLEEGRLEPELACYIGAQIAMALDAAHQIGVIHRDLAPTNILVAHAEGQADSVKVLEFGLSRLQEGGEGEESTLTAVGVRIGTPYYMAPEYIEEYALDPRADLYSLGIVLFEMITGSPPFTGRPYKVMDRHLNEVPPLLSTVVPGIPEWLDQLVAQLLEKTPEKRIQSAGEVTRRIEAGYGQRYQTVAVPAPATPVQEKRQAVPASAEDALLGDFIGAQVLSVSEGTGAPDPQESFVVDQVSKAGIASRHGVRPGWLAYLPEDRSTGMRDPRVWRRPEGFHDWVFAAPDGSKKVTLKLSGADPGVDLLRHGKQIRAFYNPLHPDDDALLELWLQGDWESLEKLSMRALSQQRGAAGVLNTGLFARFLGSGGIKSREQPALVMHGAGLIEQGKVQEGLELTSEYRVQHAQKFSPRFDAVAHYYGAVEREKVGNTDQAVEMLIQGWLRWPNRKIADRIAALTGRVPDARAWYGKQFPDYTLDVVKGRGRTVGLYDTLARLDDHQVVLVVMMAGERANAAFDEVMRRYLAWSTHFGEFIRTLHVVSDVVERDAAQPEFHQGEDLVAKAKRPFEVLEDYRGFLRRAIKPVGSPTVYAVSKQGYVVHEGQLGPVDIWDTIADVAKLRARMRR